MARKVVNRKELREKAEAAESAAGGKKKKAVKKKPTKRKKKTEKEVRMKIFWGVFNQSLKRIALYEYSQRKQAQKKATDLTASQKTPHFIQRVKEVIDD